MYKYLFDAKNPKNSKKMAKIIAKKLFFCHEKVTYQK